MTFDEICNALDQGKTVCWGNPGYNVIRDVASHQLYIKCLSTGHVAPLLHNGELPNAGMDFRILEQPGGDPPAADPVRRVWLLDLRATCLVDAVDEASARQAWEAGLEYEYEIDNEGGLLRVEPFHGREPRPADAPGELPFSFTNEEAKQLLYCLEQASTDYAERDPHEASEDQRACQSALDKLVKALPSLQSLAGEGELNDFSASMLGL